MNNLDPVDEGDEQVAYSAKPYRWRLLVITAGSLMHIIIAVLIMMFVYTAGGRYQETGRIEVLGLTEGSPAAQAGITPGDEIISINGVILETSDDFRSLMAASSVGDEVSVGFIHQDSQASARVTLVARPGEDGTGVGFLGVGTNSIGRQKLSLFSATTHMTSDLLDGMGRTIQGIGTILNPENQWSQLTDSQADPNSRPTTVVGITQVAGDIGDRDGLYGVLEILASINVFIGIFNLLPFLPFDGGHAAIATYERIRSRKGHRHHADVEKMWPLTVVVITLLLFLTFTGLYLDITRPF
jgi:membrane-associated protease RseP (regulator of RpoE activity)